MKEEQSLLVCYSTGSSVLALLTGVRRVLRGASRAWTRGRPCDRAREGAGMLEFVARPYKTLSAGAISLFLLSSLRRRAFYAPAKFAAAAPPQSYSFFPHHRLILAPHLSLVAPYLPVEIACTVISRRRRPTWPLYPPSQTTAAPPLQLSSRSSLRENPRPSLSPIFAGLSM